MALMTTMATALSTAGLVAAHPAAAVPATAGACPPDTPIYRFTNVSTSLRPTNLYSAYITGPGTITYNQTTTATATASMTASVSAEAGVVFAKASSSIGVTVGASYAAAGGFSYTLTVPAGQRRRLRLYQSSRAFTVTKKVFNTGRCTWITEYSAATNAPRKTRDDEWRLQS
jgi:hypothetical protein